jgi:ribonuclease HII
LAKHSLSSSRLTGSNGSNSSEKASENIFEVVDLWSYERRYGASGFTVIAGIDEAGRGPLAGPVVAACAVIPTTFDLNGIDDSKKLTPSQRNVAFSRIEAHATCFAVGIVDSAEIDRINILKATHLAMQRAVDALPLRPHVLLIDGRPVPTMAECEHIAIVGGDALSASIAAASIVAKVTRDRIMIEYASIYPRYGFDKHKGYSCPEHKEALQTCGPCPIHRRSFAPVAAAFEPSLF